MASVVMLDLMGGVSLLLWGLHMVRSGIIRAFGSDLRRALGIAVRSRFMALLAGIGLTAVLQSSTATGLMATSFAAAGHIDLVPALAVMLGANIGTTLIVQLLSFNVSAAAPVLFIIGLIAFNRGRRTWIRDVGRAAIGLGLMLLALHILLDSLTPAENAPAVRALLAAITGEPVLCVALGGAADVGRALKRRRRAVHHVARLLAFHHAGCGSCARARRQSGSGGESYYRKRNRDQSREPPASHWQHDQSGCGRSAAAAISSTDR
jgi:hypothetical protein